MHITLVSGGIKSCRTVLSYKRFLGVFDTEGERMCKTVTAILSPNSRGVNTYACAL